LRGKNAGKIYPIPSAGAGLVRCGECGFALTTSTSKGRRYYRCVQHDCPVKQKYVRSETIEAAIQEAIVEAAEGLAEATLAAEMVTSQDPRIVQLEDELKALKPLAHRPAVAAEIEEIEAELCQLKTAPTLAAMGAAERSELVTALAELTSEDWEARSAVERRDLYSELVERVVLRGHEVIEVVLRI